MIDVTQVVHVERDYQLDIRHPVTGRPVGITFWVKNVDCKAATDLVKRGNAARILATDGETPPGVDARDLYAACISRWEWGGNAYDGQRDPELSLDLACDLVRNPQCAWMLKQVVEATQKLENFTDI